MTSFGLTALDVGFGRVKDASGSYREMHRRVNKVCAKGKARLKGSDNPPNQVSSHRVELDPEHPAPVKKRNDSSTVITRVAERGS